MKLSKSLKALLCVGVAVVATQSAYAQTRATVAKDEPKRATVTRTAPLRAVTKEEDQDKAAAVRSSEVQTALAANVSGVQITPQLLESHEMNPAHVAGAVSDDGNDARESAALIRPLIAKARRRTTGSQAAAIKAEIAAMPRDTQTSPPAPSRPGQLKGRIVQINPDVAGEIGKLAAPQGPYLNVSGFGESFHAAIKDSVAGYALRIGKNGQTIYTLQWNWAQTPADSSLGWNPNRRMHIASVSKLMTGIAMVRLLHEKNISLDTKIINYLPSYWSKGSNINDITFRHLLTHRSGFSTGGSSSNYPFMKSNVAAGVSGVGSYDYENMNFGLCRILIAVINGNINKNANFGGFFNDLIWDAVTINAYEDYVKQKVFAPAGVSGPALTKPGSPARAYPFPVAGNGWNSGNLTSMAGGAAWHMSINEILAVMHTFRRTGNIVPPSVAQDALDDGLGVDRIINTAAGKLYDKNGLWRDGNQRTEQSVATFMPGGMDVVVFTNSPIGANGASLRNLVRDLYQANIVEP